MLSSNLDSGVRMCYVTLCSHVIAANLNMNRNCCCLRIACL